MAQVRLENISKIYDKNIKAVNNADLVIEDGKLVVLVGPSGCGKSTLLRMIAGLEEISEGNMYIDNCLVNNIQPKDRDIAMVFQNYALYPHMTVFENLAFGLKLRKYPKLDIKNRVEEAAELLGLSDYLDRKPKKLSGGQRQRVAVGRAIVRKPKVFLFDEPLSNLDAKLRVQMRIEIIKLHQQLGTTMIYVTHDQIEAMTMGDQIVVLNKGEVQQYDKPLEVYNQPTNKFVAGFIGSPAMNFFQGEIIGKAGKAIFKAKEFKLQLDENILSKINNEKNINTFLGIRPEHFRIADNGPADLSVTVEVIEQMGNETFYYLKTDIQQIILRTTQIMEIKVGQKVQIIMDKEKCHLFYQENGTKII